MSGDVLYLRCELCARESRWTGEDPDTAARAAGWTVEERWDGFGMHVLCEGC